MDEPARSSADGPYADRDPFDWLGALLGPRIDELRALLDELAFRWRGDAMRVGEGTRHRLNTVFYELGLITRDDWDDLDLRVAQLEHRLRLVEDRLDRIDPQTPENK